MLEVCGGKTFGEWKTGFRRSVWIPVASALASVVLHTLRLALARRSLRHSAALGAIGTVDERDSLQEPLPLFGPKLLEHRAIAGNRIQNSVVARNRSRIGIAAIRISVPERCRVCYASRLLDRMTASVRITAPQPNSASAWGHSVSRPTPFRKIPRRITTKYRSGIR